MTISSKKILIILLGAIGDVVRALPLATRIKAAWPDSHITWAVEPISKDVVTDHPAIDRVILFNRKQKLPGYIRFIQELRSFDFDITLDLQRHFKSGVTSWLSHSPERIGFNRRNAKEFNWIFNNEHIRAVENFSLKLEHYQLFGDLLGLPRPVKLDFGVAEKCKTLKPELEQKLAGYDRYCGVILGSSWASRFWFEDSYVELVHWLYQARGIKSLLLGGSGEAALASSISKRLSELPHLNLVGETSLNDLFPIFNRCLFAIGPDSGPMHIAAACSTRVVSLFGATSPLRSAPYGSADLVLKSDISCSPCYERNCPRLDRACMQDITVKIAQDACDRLLSQ